MDSKQIGGEEMAGEKCKMCGCTTFNVIPTAKKNPMYKCVACGMTYSRSAIKKMRKRARIDTEKESSYGYDKHYKY